MSYTNLSSVDCHTKKRRTCEWCGEVIFAGACCHRITGVFDWEMVSQYLHPECYAVLQLHNFDPYEDDYEPSGYYRGFDVNTEQCTKEEMLLG